MAQPKSKPKRPRGRPPVLKMPEHIPASVEEVAQAIFQTPPRSDSDWDFLKPGSDAFEEGKPPTKKPARKSR